MSVLLEYIVYSDCLSACLSATCLHLATSYFVIYKPSMKNTGITSNAVLTKSNITQKVSLQKRQAYTRAVKPEYYFIILDKGKNKNKTKDKHKNINKNNDNDKTIKR